MLRAEGVAEIIELAYYPWGNAYFVTKECGGAGSYNATARQCFNKKCGAGASIRPQDCFTGDIVCQHGMLECQLNRFLTCAVTETEKDASKYIPFVSCVEAGYDGAAAEELAQKCAQVAHLSYDSLKFCYDGSEGTKAMQEQAMATPEHGGVPYILIDGKPLEDENTLLDAVCKAYHGPDPKGCAGHESIIMF